MKHFNKKDGGRMNIKKLFKLHYLLAVLLLIASVSISEAAKGDKEAGKKVYEKKCAWCHGWTGAGDGPAADFLNPRPRDFTSGIYKYKTSNLDNPFPYEEDIYKMIANGMTGTSMPFWKDVLSDKDMWNLVAYVKSLAGLEGEPTAKINYGKQVSSSADSIKKGKELFIDRCSECHGDEGKGDATKKLKDDWVGNRLWPRNLTKPWLFRAGSDPKDIYSRISTGIPGTPMPAFDDPASKKKLSDEEKWHVVNYVTSIKNEARRIKDGDTVVKAKRLTGELPKDVNDEKWKDVESTAYPLVGQIIGKERFFTPSVEDITVKAVYNDKDIAFLLEWDDRTNSIPGDAKAQELADGELNEDAVAIQLPVTIPEEMEKPYFGMGDGSHPVNVWHWKSGTSKDTQSVKVMDATGFKNIKARDKSSVTAKGSYNKGTWKVMMTRPLKTDNKDDMQFEEGRFTPIAFATWDGTNKEKGSKHTITTWYWILLKPPTGSKVVFIPLLVAGIVLGAELLIARSVQKK